MQRKNIFRLDRYIEKNLCFRKTLLTATAFFAVYSYLAQADFQKALQTEMIQAEDGDVMIIAEMHFFINSTLSIEGKNNIKIVGAGMDKTILDFAKQIDGTKGLRVSKYGEKGRVR